jgi:hypothetical protein
MFMMKGGATRWRSYLQKTATLFSIEAECVVAADAAWGATRLRRLLQELGALQNEPTCKNGALGDNSVSLVT